MFIWWCLLLHAVKPCSWDWSNSDVIRPSSVGFHLLVLLSHVSQWGELWNKNSWIAANVLASANRLNSCQPVFPVAGEEKKSSRVTEQNNSLVLAEQNPKPFSLPYRKAVWQKICRTSYAILNRWSVGCLKEGCQILLAQATSHTHPASIWTTGDLWIRT